ncbi:MAG TPA: hypothetical protein VF070_05940 [Streptosporangiaceae bacterium]
MTLDLRQFTTWCRLRSLPLFAVRRADIEAFARDLEDYWTLTITRKGGKVAGPQRAWRTPGCRRARSTVRARADLAARTERAARLRSHRC